MVLETRNLKSRNWQGHAPWKSLWDNPFLPLPDSCGSWCLLVCGSRIPSLPSLSHALLCFCIFSIISTPVIRFRTNSKSIPCHLEILNLISSAKTLFLNNVTFIDMGRGGRKRLGLAHLFYEGFNSIHYILIFQRFK